MPQSSRKPSSAFAHRVNIYALALGPQVEEPGTFGPGAAVASYLVDKLPYLDQDRIDRVLASVGAGSL